MENHSTFDRHPLEEVFDEYIFNRLSEDQCACFEEHLLACQSCRQELEKTEQYIRAFKSCALDYKVEKRPARLRHVFAFAALAAVAAAVAIAIPYRTHADHSVPLELVSLRGGAEDSVAHAHAGAGIDFRIDCTDLGETSGLRVEVVDALGGAIWSGAAVAQTGSNLISAHVGRRFSAGVYWVRLYSPQGELLREFGVRAE